MAKDKAEPVLDRFSGKGLAWLLPYIVFLLILPVTHTVALRLLALVCILVLCISVFRPAGVLKQSLLIPFAVWGGLVAASLVYSIDVDYSLGEFKNELGYALVAFLGFYGISAKKDAFDILLKVLLFSGCALVIWASIGYLQEGGWSDEARYGGVGDYSSYMIYLLPFLFLWKFRNPGTINAALLALLIAGVCVTAYWTENRMFWVSLSIEIAVLAAIYALLRKHYWVMPLGGLLFLGALWFGLSIRAEVELLEFGWSEFMFVMGDDSRLSFWPGVVESIWNQPWYGYGFGRSIFSQAHPELAPPDDAILHAHNIFLDAGVQLGVPGIIVLIWLFSAIVWKYWSYVVSQNSQLLGIGVAGIVFMAGILSKNMTDDFFIRHHALFFWAVTGLLIGYGERIKADLASAK